MIIGRSSRIEVLWFFYVFQHTGMCSQLLGIVSNENNLAKYHGTRRLQYNPTDITLYGNMLHIEHDANVSAVQRTVP